MGCKSRTKSIYRASIVHSEIIEHKILLIRGQKVILDIDLAELYGAETRRLNQQVRRNIARFPADFCFQLGAEEYINLKSHFATSSLGWGGKRKLPFAFTEHGAIMAASVLNTPRAVEMSVFVVRAASAAAIDEIEGALAAGEKGADLLGLDAAILAIGPRSRTTPRDGSSGRST